MTPAPPLPQSFTATFKGWKSPAGVVFAEGPFTVQVFEEITVRRTRWKARVKPTNQVINGHESKTVVDAKAFVESQFKARLGDWKAE